MKFNLLLSLVAVLLLGCKSDDGKTLFIYTSFDSKEASDYVKKFEKDTGIDVNWVRMSTGETLARIDAEKNNPQVSLWFGGPSPEFMVATQKGLFEPYQVTKGPIPAKFHDGERNWLGFYFGALGFASNEKALKKRGIEPPKSWADLLKPEFKGKISMAYPYTSGTAYTIVSTIIQLMGDEKGWEYIKKLDAQIHHYNKSGSAAVTQAGLEEIYVGLAFSHDILKKGPGAGYPVVLTFPEEGTGYEIGAMALVKGGKQHGLAKKFVDYYMSEGGQNHLQHFYRTPLHPKAEIAEKGVTAESVKLIEFNAAEAARRHKEVIAKWREVTGR